MKTILKPIAVYCILFISLIVKAQRNEPVILENNDIQKINFSGYIGKPSGKMFGAMVADMPADSLESVCTFFKGDSLEGFDYNQASDELRKDGFKLYLEFRTMMYRKQCDFVKNKFHLSVFPANDKSLKHVEPPTVLTSSCANLDFEDGNLSNWVISSGYNTNSNGNLTIPAAGAGLGTFNTNQGINSCEDVNLITAAYGNDPLGFPGLDPNGGTTSARLGGFQLNTSNGYGFGCNADKWNMGTQANGEILEQTFVVTPSNALISFDYAVVLNDGGHGNGQQPYFHVFVKDATSGTILSSCTQYFVQASAGMAPAGFVNSGFVNGYDLSALYFRNWTSNSINLTPYIGQTVNIEFVAAGCIAGAHMAWAYVDVTCGPAQINASNIAPCISQSVSLTAPSVFGGSYLWSGSGVTGLTTQSVSINTSGTYTVIVTPPQGAACSYTLTKTITYNSPPDVTASTPGTLTCNSASINVAISSTTTPISYNWSGAGISAGAGTGTITVNQPGTYNYTVTNISSGCSTNGSLPVTQNTIVPTVAGSVSDTLTCTNTTVTANATTTTNPVSYNWTGSGITAGSGTGTVTIDQPGTYSYTVTNTVNGCKTTGTRIVTQNTITPTISSSVSGILNCTLTSVNINVTTTSAPVSYSWSGIGITSTTNSNTINVNQSGTFNYTVTNTINGCSTSSSESVSQNTITPGLTVSGNQTITCASPTVTLTGSATPSTCTPVWTGGVSDGATSYTATASAANIYTLTVSNPANGCINTGTVEVMPSAGFPFVTTSTSNSITCITNTAQVIATTTANPVSYSWTGPDIISGTTNDSAIVNAGGQYTVVVTNTLSMCSSTLMVTVPSSTNPITPILSISNNISCSTPTATINSLPSSSVTYTWSGTGITSSLNNQNVDVALGGVYTLSITNLSDGCVGSATISVTSNTTIPIINSSVSSFTSTCTTPTVQLSVTIIPSSNITYTWATPPTGSLNNFNSLNPVANGSGTFSLTVTDITSGCFNSQVFSLTQNTVQPVISAMSTFTFNCGANSITLSANTIPTSGVNYSWAGPSGGSISGANTSNPDVDASGIYSLTVTDLLNGCTSTATVDVVQDNVIAAFTANPTGGHAPLTVNFNNTSTGASTYNWTFGDGNNSININPNNIYNGNGTYTVTLIASTPSCADTAYAIIIVEDPLSLYIPNVFSPNNDGVNDVFCIKSTGIKEISLLIFNRWGQKLYEFSGDRAAWDGKESNGNNAPDGTYFFMVKAKGFDEKEIEKQGTLNLFR